MFSALFWRIFVDLIPGFVRIRIQTLTIWPHSDCTVYKIPQKISNLSFYRRPVKKRRLAAVIYRYQRTIWKVSSVSRDIPGLGIRSFDFRANHSFFVQKWANERFAQKMSDSLICSFLVSDLSDSLTIAHFLWVTWPNRSWLLIFGEQPEQFAHIAHLTWAKWAIHSHRSPKKRKWAKMSNSLIFSIFFIKIVYKTYYSKTRF